MFKIKCFKCHRSFITHTGKSNIGSRISKLLSESSTLIEHFKNDHPKYDLNALNINCFINHIHIMYRYHEYEDLTCNFNMITRFKPVAINDLMLIQVDGDDQ